MKKNDSLKFNAKKHTYKKGKQQYTSVTTHLKQFFAPFDAKKIAIGCMYRDKAKGIKSTMRTYLKKWKEDAEHGTRVHEIISLNKSVLDKDVEFRDIQKHVQAIMFLASQKYIYKSHERMISNDELMLAGTIDCILQHADGSVDIVDWKTNKDIKRTAYKGEKAKSPFEMMDDCAMSKYILQLSYYKYMLEATGVKVNKCILVHLLEDSYNAIEVEPLEIGSLVKLPPNTKF